MSLAETAAVQAQTLTATANGGITPTEDSTSRIPYGGTGEKSAHIADASVAHALNATFSDTEAEAALNALGTKINLILDVLEAHGLTATS